ncbi:unnamed protein product [Prorocentrum cordatum]|uniref:Uncharacterized protein n=1 Tax=Prorocentrum cordatum TaxID=2364126 RepID=A0ABN9UWD6_9DINO|nr:unnamed protein product [Polarella glacialis]
MDKLREEYRYAMAKLAKAEAAREKAVKAARAIVKATGDDNALSEAQAAAAEAALEELSDKRDSSAVTKQAPAFVRMPSLRDLFLEDLERSARLGIVKKV